MSHEARKYDFGHVRPAKIQIRLRICAVWSESSEDSDQTAHLRSLIRIFTGRILDSQGCKGRTGSFERTFQKARSLTLRLKRIL